MFVLNFVISGKVSSLPKVIKYVKRSKYSFHDFSAKHTPSATLKSLGPIDRKFHGHGKNDELTNAVFFCICIYFLPQKYRLLTSDIHYLANGIDFESVIL